MPKVSSRKTATLGACQVERVRKGIEKKRRNRKNWWGWGNSGDLDTASRFIVHKVSWPSSNTDDSWMMA